MTIKVNRKTTKGEFEKKIRSLSAEKIDLKKYSGVLKPPVDGLMYQKEIRREWD